MHEGVNEDKYRLWKVLHPKEGHCKYCRKRGHTFDDKNGCPISWGYPFGESFDARSKCREFLKEENYMVPTKRFGYTTRDGVWVD